MPLPFQVRNHHGEMEQPRPPPSRVSRFRRLLVRVSAAERLAGDGKERDRDERPPSGETEAGSVGLDRMVLSFMEDAAVVERPPRGCCNCFNGSGHHDGSDDEEFDFLPSDYFAPAASAAAGDALEALKVQTWFGAERERGRAEPPRRRVQDRRAVPQGRQEEGRRPPRRRRRPQSPWLRRRRLQVAVGEDPLLPRRRARVHRRGGGGGGDEADRGGGLPVGVRGGAVDQGVPRGASGAAAALRGDPGPARADRRRRCRGRAAEPEEEGPPLPALAQARVHARQVALPSRPLLRQAGATALDVPHAGVGRELLRRVRAAVRREDEGARCRRRRRRRQHRRGEDHGGGVAVAVAVAAGGAGGEQEEARGEGGHRARLRALSAAWWRNNNTY